MKPASARRISSHADGPDVARARGRPATSAPNGPISSARSVPRRGKAPGWSCPGATPTPWRRTSSRSAAVDPGAHAVLIVDQAGWHLTPKLAIPDNITVLALPPRSPELNPVENGNSCATTGCRTGSSNPTTSSRCAAKPGTTSSTNHGRSCPSACANGRMF